MTDRLAAYKLQWEIPKQWPWAWACVELVWVGHHNYNFSVRASYKTTWQITSSRRTGKLNSTVQPKNRRMCTPALPSHSCHSRFLLVGQGKTGGWVQRNRASNQLMAVASILRAVISFYSTNGMNVKAVQVCTFSYVWLCVLCCSVHIFSSPGQGQGKVNNLVP